MVLAHSWSLGIRLKCRRGHQLMLDMSSSRIKATNSRSPRILRACDACRLRKTRCDLSTSTQNTPCTRCRRLGLQCTFNLGIEKRGPKKKRIDNISSAPNGNSSENVHLTAKGLALTADGRLRPFPTDSICSRVLLRTLVDDYLAFVYPLVPVVHRPSFLIHLDEDRDVYDNDFLGLLIAICAAVIGLMPSRFESYRNLDPGSLHSRSRVDVVNSCQALLDSLRGPDYYDNVGFDKWAISYLMLVALFQVGKHNRSRMMEVESLQLGRLLNFHHIEEYRDLDCIETQLRKKGFWLLFYAYVHSEVQNFRKEKLSFLDHVMMESIDLEALMPLDVDDEQIYKDCVVTLPTQQPKLSTGFIIHSRIFWQGLEDPCAKRKTQCMCCRVRSPTAQIRYLTSRLEQLRYALDEVPAQFRQCVSPLSIATLDPAISSQFATQRANIHVTHLWLQSLLLDQLGLLTTPEEQWHDREAICIQLLHVLNTISLKDMEPNGNHLVYKVRDVAVGLLACPFAATDPAARRAQDYVKEFTSIMARLDSSEMVHTANLQSWIDIGRQNT